MTQDNEARTTLPGEPQPVGEWTPLADDTYWDDAKVAFVHVKGDLLQTGYDYDPGIDVRLRENIRLCRRVANASSAGAGVTMPFLSLDHVWRWAQLHAERTEQFGDMERVALMRQEIDTVKSWLYGQHAPALPQSTQEGDE